MAREPIVLRPIGDWVIEAHGGVPRFRRGHGTVGGGEVKEGDHHGDAREANGAAGGGGGGSGDHGGKVEVRD
eukprot:6633087-Prymnesium_polylepis.1